MDKFSDHLRALMRERGINAAELARKAALSEASISGYLNGKKEPRGAQSVSIARALGVTMDTLWQTEFAPVELSEEEAHLVNAFRRLNTIGRQKLATYISDLINSGHEEL